MRLVLPIKHKTKKNESDKTPNSFKKYFNYVITKDDYKLWVKRLIIALLIQVNYKVKN